MDNEQADKVFEIFYKNFAATWTNLIRCQWEASATKYAGMQHGQDKVFVLLLARTKFISGQETPLQYVSILAAHFLSFSF